MYNKTNEVKHMSIVVRPAQLDDYESIYLLNRDGFGYDFALEETRSRLEYILSKTDNYILVAEKDGAMVGYIHAADYECTYAHSMKNILSLVVDEQCRGQGIGRMLLGAVEEWAQETGASGVRLVSGFTREKAHAFYLACGYKNRKNQRNFMKKFFD